MTCIFDEVHKDQKLKANLEYHRPPNTEIDEVLYADGTIVFSTNEHWTHMYQKSKKSANTTDSS